MAGAHGNRTHLSGCSPDTLDLKSRRPTRCLFTPGRTEGPPMMPRGRESATGPPLRLAAPAAPPKKRPGTAPPPVRGPLLRQPPPMAAAGRPPSPDLDPLHLLLRALRQLHLDL